MNTYLQILLGICAVTSSGVVAFAQLKKGNRVESSDIVKFYKDKMEEYKEMSDTLRKDYTAKHEQLIKEVAEVRGELNAEKKLREQYEAILKDKNPETENFMKYMVQATKDQSESHREIVRVLSEIHAMSKAEHDRDFVVNATVTKT